MLRPPTGALPKTLSPFSSISAREKAEEEKKKKQAKDAGLDKPWYLRVQVAPPTHPPQPPFPSSLLLIHPLTHHQPLYMAPRLCPSHPAARPPPSPPPSQAGPFPRDMRTEPEDFFRSQIRHWAQDARGAEACVWGVGALRRRGMGGCTRVEVGGFSLVPHTR